MLCLMKQQLSQPLKLGCRGSLLKAGLTKMALARQALRLEV